jgi:hypothetical protein
MTAPTRPVFSEGQVLAAADLAATVQHARGVDARHARHLHDWGIAEGLTLVTENRTDPATNARYVEVSVSAGMAIDGTGRELVVPSPVVLSEGEFEAVNGADQPTADPYPVFLAATDREVPVTGLVSCGGATGPTRVNETYQVLFGRLGDELLVADQEPPGVGAPPASPPVRWLVLLGFVVWTDGHFTRVAPSARGVRPRYAGVRADTVVARSGRLELRSQTTVQEGKPAIVLSGEDPPSLVFGLYQGTGSISPLMTVAANGNLTIAGSFAGRIPAGTVLIASGTATDGMVLPLPAGVTPEEVADGRVALHVHLVPTFPPTTTGTMLTSVVEATVDDSRRVRCRIRFYDPIIQPAEVVERPGSVEFLVLATVAATDGGG